MNSNFEYRYETLQKRPGRFETLKKNLVFMMLVLKHYKNDPLDLNTEKKTE